MITPTKAMLESWVASLEQVSEAEFDMLWYVHRDHPSMSGPECGTPACALGHIAAHYMHLHAVAKGKETLEDTEEAFSEDIPEVFRKQINFNSETNGSLSSLCARVATLINEEVDSWLFASSWKKYDNTLAGAIARMRYLIAGNAVPGEIEYRKQSSTSLSYQFAASATEWIALYSRYIR